MESIWNDIFNIFDDKCCAPAKEFATNSKKPEKVAVVPPAPFFSGSCFECEELGLGKKSFINESHSVVFIYVQ